MMKMDELTRKVVKAMEEALGGDTEPCRSDLAPIARKLGATLMNGASRWAFVFKERKVVYKFPRWEDTETDYCELEVRNYELGQQYGIEKCLLPITKVATTESGIPLYIQPMYTKSHNDLGYDQEKFLAQKVHSLHNKPIVRRVRDRCYSSPHSLWVERAIQIYGKAFMRSFEAWSVEGRVNDLHSSNIGYLGKQPIIIDYAGYHG